MVQMVGMVGMFLEFRGDTGYNVSDILPNCVLLEFQRKGVTRKDGPQSHYFVGVKDRIITRRLVARE